MVYGALRDKEFTFDGILLIWHHYDLKPLLSEIQDGRHCLFNTIFIIWVECAALLTVSGVGAII